MRMDVGVNTACMRVSSFGPGASMNWDRHRTARGRGKEGGQYDLDKGRSNMKKILMVFVLMAFLLAIVNCASWNKTTRGAVIGGAVGAVLGGVCGPAARTNLAELAKILNKYPDTNILIEGHTDDTGTDEHNMTLSKDRAQAVALYMATLEVKSARFSTTG